MRYATDRRSSLLTSNLQILVLAVGLCGGLAQVAVPQPTAARTTGPRIKVAEEVFDFGVVPQRSFVSHVFWLRNTGDETVVIEKLIPNCGCTQAPLEEDRVAPGDSARVELIFGSGLFKGSVKKFTQIVSDAAGRVPALTITAHVVAASEEPGPLTANPRAVNLDTVRPEPGEAGWEYRVTLRNNGGVPIRITAIDRPDRGLAVEGVDATLQPGEEHKIALRFEADLPSQVFSKSVTFLALDSTEARLTVPVFKTMRWGPTPLLSGNLGRKGR